MKKKIPNEVRRMHSKVSNCGIRTSFGNNKIGKLIAKPATNPKNHFLGLDAKALFGKYADLISLQAACHRGLTFL